MKKAINHYFAKVNIHIKLSQRSKTIFIKLFSFHNNEAEVDAYNSN